MSSMAELAELIGRATPRDGSHPTAVAELTLSRSAWPSAPVAAVYEPSLCVIAQGAKRVRVGDEELRFDPGHFLLTSVAVPLTARVVEASADSPYLGLRIDLDPAVVIELASGMGERVAGPPGRGLAVGPVDAALVGAAARLVELSGAPRDIPALAPLVLRELTYRLLAGPLGARLRQLAAPDGHARRVAEAVGRLRARPAELLPVAELARAARLSPSAFHAHFKAVTGMSPLQYQKQLRLREARRLMLGGLGAAEAAFRVGYESPSQFSREYRRLFGAPPGRDAAALKAEAG